MKCYCEEGKIENYIELVCRRFLRQVETINGHLKVVGIKEINKDELEEL